MTPSEMHHVQAQRNVGLGSREASTIPSWPSDTPRAAPLQRQCVLQRQAKDPQAVYQIQYKEVGVPMHPTPCVRTLVRPWCRSNGSGDYNTEIHFTEVSKKRNRHLPCYGRPGSVGPLEIDLISLFLWLYISPDTA